MLESDEQALSVIPIAPKFGGPIRLTPKVFIRILRLIRIGWSVPDACRSEGVTYRRFRQLCQTRPVYQRHYEQADQVRFNLRKETCEQLVHMHAEKQWIAAMTWLERRVPELWSLRRVDRPEVQETLIQVGSQLRILTVSDADFLELQKEPGYTVMNNGGLEMIDGNVRIQVFPMTHNERLLG